MKKKPNMEMILAAAITFDALMKIPAFAEKMQEMTKESFKEEDFKKK